MHRHERQQRSSGMASACRQCLRWAAVGWAPAADLYQCPCSIESLAPNTLMCCMRRAPLGSTVALCAEQIPPSPSCCCLVSVANLSFGCPLGRPSLQFTARIGHFRACNTKSQDSIGPALGRPVHVTAPPRQRSSATRQTLKSAFRAMLPYLLPFTWTFREINQAHCLREWPWPLLPGPSWRKPVLGRLPGAQ